MRNGDVFTIETSNGRYAVGQVIGHPGPLLSVAVALFDHILEASERRPAQTNDDGSMALDRLPYLDATLKEVLRLRPVIPAVGRRVKVPMVVGGYDIPAGMLLVPAVWLTHRLPDIYPEPEQLGPERFLDAKPDPYAWLPFGGAVRRCLGMAFALFEMKIVLATVLSRVSLRLASNKPSRVVLRSFTHAPRGNVPVIVEERYAASRSRGYVPQEARATG